VAARSRAPQARSPPPGRGRAPARLARRVRGPIGPDDSRTAGRYHAPRSAEGAPRFAPVAPVPPQLPPPPRAPPSFLVQAAAAHGKPSRRAQWRREHLAQGRVVAWLTAQPQDDIQRFVQGLALAVRAGARRPPLRATPPPRAPA